MAKNKTDKPKINFDGKDYEFEDFNDEQKMMVAHIDDIQKKLNNYRRFQNESRWKHRTNE